MGASQKFEDILVMVGDQGRWQYMVFLFTWIEGILIGCHHLSSVFLGYSPNHWCDFNATFPNTTLPDWSVAEKKNFSIPRNEDGEFESCKIYNIAGKQLDCDFEVALKNRDNTVIACSHFEYATDMGWTTVAEWDLVCDR